jgi:carboxyl-terminal processing protease
MKRRRSLVAVLAVMCPVLLVSGIYLGGHPELLPEPARETLVADTEARIYGEALDQLADDYYRPVDKGELLDRSLDAAVTSLDDRFSNYFTPSDYSDFQESTQGAFVGIGVSVRDQQKLARGLEILTVYESSPAARAGLRVGDLIVEVDGRPTRGLSTEQVTARIRGREGTEVALTVRTDGGKARTRKVKRARVAVPIVRSELERSGGSRYAHVRVSAFTSGVHGSVRQAVDRALRKGARGVVLDLRHNGGGLLNEAVLMSSIFIDEGTIVTTDGRSKPRQVYSATGGAIDSKVPVVVLVDKASASASEIVAGALQDRKRAKLVGTETFGKGVFQEVKQLPNGGALDITVGEYFTPSGRNLGGGGVKQGSGLEPDVRAKDDPGTKRDEALDRALAELAG